MSDRRRASGRRLTAMLLLGSWMASGVQAQSPPTPPDPSLRERAAAAERRGEFSAAADIYLELLKTTTNDPDLYLAAGNCLGRSGRYNDALDLLEGVSARFPDVLALRAMTARTYSLKARSMIDAGVVDAGVSFTLQDAIRTAGLVLKHQPDHLEALLIVAQCHLDLGELKEAEEHAAQIVAKHPQHPGGHILVGTIAFNEFVTARRKIVDEKPTGAELADLQARTKSARNRSEPALLQAVKLDPARALAQGKLGDLSAWEGDLQAAADRYALALGVDPEVGIAHDWVRTNIRPTERQQVYESALAAYVKRPGMVSTKTALLEFYLGLALYDQGKGPDSRKAFQSAVLKNPGYLNAHYYMMHAAYWDGEHEVAVREAATYARTAPRAFADLIRTLPATDNSVAILEFAADRSFRAARHGDSRDIHHVLALVLDTERHWNNYAFLCRETGQYEASLEGYQRALEKNPTAPQLLNDAAVILQYHLATADNLALARSYYQRAIQHAEEILKDSTATAEQKRLARTALHDARNNLALLPK